VATGEEKGRGVDTGGKRGTLELKPKRDKGGKENSKLKKWTSNVTENRKRNRQDPPAADGENSEAKFKEPKKGAGAYARKRDRSRKAAIKTKEEKKVYLRGGGREKYGSIKGGGEK